MILMKKTLILFLCFSAVLFSQKRPFTIADLYKIKSVSSFRYAPDGKRIVFVVSESHLKEGKTNSEIYLMNADGSAQRKLTSNPAADYAPQWSPDGKYIFFLSTRKNGAQLWKLSLEGGEPEQVTDLSSGVDNVKLAPDGKGFIFSADVYPEHGADDAMNKKTDDAKENGPIQAHMADRLLYRHWTSWADGKRTHTFYYNLETKKHIDLTPGDYDAPGFGMSAAEFSPEGTEVCFVSNHDPVEATSTNKDLFIIPSAGGTAKNITKANTSYDGEPVYSPNGKYIAYRTQKIPGYEADLFRIALYDRMTGQTEVISEGKFDNWVNECQWSPDSKSLYFTADVQGNIPLYSIDIKTKSITQVLNARSIDAFTIAPDGRTVLYTRRSVGEPVEMWKASLEKGIAKNPVRLTTFNKSMEDSVDIRPVEELWIQSPTGKKIHTFIVKPHNFDPKKKYPLILNVHGGPQSQWADAFRGDWQVYPGSGYIVAFPNPHGSTGYGQEFTAAISKDWGGKVYEDVMAVADSLSKISFVDADRMGAMGWSYGGYMMMWLEGHTTRFKAIASMMGVYNLKAMHGTTEELWFPEWDLNGPPYENPMYQQWSPNQFVKNFKTPCLVITGERDYRVSYNQSLEFFTDLQRMNVPSRLIVFPNDGHWPHNVKSMPLYYNAHLDWFHKYLGGEPAPYDMTKMVRNQAFE
jgi:dipeptidyl aminopeptidase/acylaminoacyl peptidase